MVCGSLDFNKDILAILEGFGLEEGANSDPKHFVIEKAFRRLKHPIGNEKTARSIPSAGFFLAVVDADYMPRASRIFSKAPLSAVQDCPALISDLWSARFSAKHPVRTLRPSPLLSPDRNRQPSATAPPATLRQVCQCLRHGLSSVFISCVVAVLAAASLWHRQSRLLTSCDRCCISSDPLPPLRSRLRHRCACGVGEQHLSPLQFARSCSRCRLDRPLSLCRRFSRVLCRFGRRLCRSLQSRRHRRSVFLRSSLCSVASLMSARPLLACLPSSASRIAVSAMPACGILLRASTAPSSRATAGSCASPAASLPLRVRRASSSTASQRHPCRVSDFAAV